MAINKTGRSYAVDPKFAEYLVSSFLTRLECEIERVGGDSASRFGLVYQRECFLSKYMSDQTDSPELRRHRAIVKWLRVEQNNARTNSRLFSTESVLWKRRNRDVTTTDILRRAADIVKGVIGLYPPERLQGRFSGGATTSRKRQVGCVASKYIGTLDATPGAVPFFLAEIADSIWAHDPDVVKPRLVKGNVLFTVPKKTDIDRVACKEPDVNVFLQKAVGTFIRKRLFARCRIDLNDQTINQRLAREASRRGHLATIDLSSASDSLTDSLVRWLVPPEWYKLLDALRSPKTFIDGKSKSLEMFSSMGNGFTFELESLVFFALAKATAHLSEVRGEISVYGDDIIVPTTIFRRVINVLRFCGFHPNTEKTFGTGRFRESCGGHYYGGVDVTPFYLRRPIKDTSDLILFLNQLRSWIIRLGLDWEVGPTGVDLSADTAFTSLWREGSLRVPPILHGGHDVASRYQLVTVGKARCRLSERTYVDERAQDKLSKGAYLSRLHDMEAGGSPKEFPYADLNAISSNPFVVRTTKWRAEYVGDLSWVFGLTRPLFVQEQHNWWFGNPG